MPIGAITPTQSPNLTPNSWLHPKRWLLLASVMLVAMMAGCSTSDSHDDTRLSLDKQSVMTVKMSKYQPSFAFDGIIIPTKSAVMDIASDARVDEIYVEAGDEVEAGAVLLRYSPDAPSQIASLDGVELNADIGPNADIELSADFNGTVTQLYAVAGTHYPKNTPLIELQDLSTLKFVSRLSATLVDHIKIGDAVTFGIDGVAHTGQISQVDTVIDDNRLIDVHVMIALTPSQNPQNLLGRSVVGHINYGQIQVGVMMPHAAIFDADMNPVSIDAFMKPPHKPETPVDGQIWVIKQNHRLALSPVKLLEYYPKNQQFLVQGITEDSLVVTRALPKSAHDQEVRLD